MKFTSEDLMKAIGLKVGDRVRCNKLLGTVFEVIKMDNGSIALDGLQTEWHSIHELIDKDFEILPAPKRVGDLKCDGNCPSCPCIYVCNEEVNAIDKTLYEVLELGIATFTKMPKKLNGAIYDVIKSQLDKEVKDDENSINNNISNDSNCD